MNGATVEDDRCRTENKVGSACDVTIGKILAALLSCSINGILISKNTAIPKDAPVAFHMKGNCLSYFSR